MPSRPAPSLRRLLLSWIVTGVLFLATLAQAAPGPHEDPARLARLAEQWLTSRHPWQGRPYDVSIRAESLDARLQLARCAQEPQLSLPPGQRIGARTLLQLQCPQQAGWKLLLPVAVQARTEVLVANQALPAGTLLDERQVSRQRRDIAGLPQGYLAPERLGEVRARMTIPAGAIIAAPATAPLPRVLKGQHVNLEARLGGIVIAMAGEVLADAATGERVRVRNRQSGKIVEGLVGADGQVAMQP